MNRSLLSSALLVAVVAACRPPEAPPPPDVRVFLRTNRYDEAVAEAERLVAADRTIQNLAVLAVARAAQASTAGSPLEGAADALLQALALGSRGQVAQAFAEEVSGSMAFAGARFTGAATVLASMTEGWDGAADPTDTAIGAAAFLAMGSYGGEHQAPPEAVGMLVRAATGLIEAATSDLAFPEDAQHWAWSCFTSAAIITASATDARADQLADTAVSLAVRIAEANPQLSIAIACDLGSPWERLREAVRQRHDADSLTRMSNVLDSAEGCSVGTYAP
jgi:hypothetical protein